MIRIMASMGLLIIHYEQIRHGYSRLINQRAKSIRNKHLTMNRNLNIFS